jgi:glutaredoxin
MAKDYFTEKGVGYSDYNVGTDTEKRKEMVEISGQLGVPVIVIDHKDVVVGFDKKTLAHLLEIPA